MSPGTVLGDGLGIKNECFAEQRHFYMMPGSGNSQDHFFMANLDGKGRWRMKLNFLKGSPPRIKYWLEEGLGGRYDLGVQ